MDHVPRSLLRRLVVLTLAFNNSAWGVLVSHWSFDDGVGQTAVDSVGSNHGTLGASASAGADDPTWTSAAKIGTNALNFDGVGDFVDIGSPTTLNVTAVTMAAWVQLDVTKRHAVMDKTNNSSSGNGLHMRVGVNTTDDRLRAFVGNVGGGIADSAGAVPKNPAWAHVAMTSNGTSLQLYINGVPETPVALTSGIMNNGNQFRIGGSAVLGSTYDLDGRVDDVGFWSNVLTTPQVRALVTLGNNATLNYDLSKAQELFDLHADAGGSVIIDGREWTYASGLTHALGETIQNGGHFFLRLHADGSGVQSLAVPEPSTGCLLALATFVLRRRRACMR